MYHSPTLDRYGTLRELTADVTEPDAKSTLVNDIASVHGQGGNDGCNLQADPGTPAGCPSA
jgi:hypothetical protein